MADNRARVRPSAAEFAMRAAIGAGGALRTRGVQLQLPSVRVGDWGCISPGCTAGSRGECGSMGGEEAHGLLECRAVSTKGAMSTFCRRRVAVF